MLPVAYIGDPYLPGPVPLFPPGIITGPGGSVKVLICGRPVALLGTLCTGPSGLPTDPITIVSSKVLIEGRPVARVGDLTASSGLLFFVNPKVLIG